MPSVNKLDEVKVVVKLDKPTQLVNRAKGKGAFLGRLRRANNAFKIRLRLFLEDIIDLSGGGEAAHGTQCVAAPRVL